MEKYYLAVDIGASSGRHMLSWIEDGKICLEEVYRFENSMKRKDGHMCWNLEALFQEILNGLKKCKEIGKIPSTMGIDTWAVDYVLLNKENQILGETYGYRDHRTAGMDEAVYSIISQEELYGRTGIQRQIFNTIYQLMAVKEQHPEHMEKAESFLLVPDYFNYLLTGVKKTEYTNATTTQLVNHQTKAWDLDLIRTLGFNETIFGPITMAGTTVGNLQEKIQREVGYDLEVLQAATHDTASAVLAVPSLNKDFLYISSGTWSLMGVEQMEANCRPESRLANLTNEGGYEYRYRFLKNIMGLWMIQSVRHELDDKYSFAQLCELAAQHDDFLSRVDVNDNAFLAPESMIKAVQDYCGNTNQKVPKSVGEIAATIYKSLAKNYGETVDEIERITGRKYKSIHIVGGGANAAYLNQLTANTTRKIVYSGPTEATSIGNIVVQMLKDHIFDDLEEARACIYQSFDIQKYQPNK